MARAFEAVLFDFAGTLFMPRDPVAWVRAAAAGLDEPALASLAADYERAGLPGGPYPATVPPELAEIYAARDLGPGNHRAAYVGLLSQVEAPIHGLAEALYELVLSPDHWIPYADTLAVVDDLLAAGIRVGVISNVAFDLRPILRAHGLGPLADRCTMSFEHGAIKPSPELFTAALDTLGASPSATLMVGDHPIADAGAAALGCPTLLLPMTASGGTHGLDRVRTLALPQR